MRAPISPYPCQHLAYSVFCLVSNYGHPSKYLTAGLICISLMSHAVEHLFMCLLVPGISFGGNVYSSHCPFSNWVFVFLLLFLIFF